MKVVPIAEAASQLGKLVTDALSGEAVYLTNGSQRVQLTPQSGQKSEIDFNSPEWKAELLAGMEGKTEPYSSEDIKRACYEALKLKKSA
jgi:hypothetical protein